jgi:hypothetical protein
MNEIRMKLLIIDSSNKNSAFSDAIKYGKATLVERVAQESEVH